MEVEFCVGLRSPCGAACNQPAKTEKRLKLPSVLKQSNAAKSDWLNNNEVVIAQARVKVFFMEHPCMKIRAVT